MNILLHMRDRYFVAQKDGHQRGAELNFNLYRWGLNEKSQGVSDGVNVRDAYFVPPKSEYQQKVVLSPPHTHKHHSQHQHFRISLHESDNGSNMNFVFFHKIKYAKFYLKILKHNDI